MPRSIRPLPSPPSGLIAVSVIAKDERGFTHYYEPVQAPPAAVREAYDLLLRAAESHRATADTGAA